MTPTTEEAPRRHFYVARSGSGTEPEVLQIEADTVCQSQGWLMFKKEGERVGGVRAEPVIAWWVVEEGAAGPLRCATVEGVTVQCLCDEVETPREEERNRWTVRYRYKGHITATLFRNFDAWWKLSDPATSS